MAARIRSGHTRFWWGFNAFVALALGLALALMVNLFFRRHVLRFDWSLAQASVLSVQTMSILDALDEDVDVFVCFRPSEPLLKSIRVLLRDYAHVSSRIKPQYIDPDRDIAKAKALTAWLGGFEPNVVVFRNSRRSVMLRRDDLAVFEDAQMPPDKHGRILLFNGEGAFSAALLRMNRQDMPRVYFLAGHGEHSIDDYDTASGYSDFAGLLRRQNMAPSVLFLSGSDTVPHDADALVVAGAGLPPAPVEFDHLRAYLERGGRIMFLLDIVTPVELTAFLAEWGVRVGPLRVVDKTLTGREVLARNFGDHPAAIGLAGATVVFNLPQQVQPLAGSEGAAPAMADRPTVSVLAKTSDDGFATPDLESMQPEFNDETDQPGPISLAVAVERGPGSGLKVELAPARLVVAGDSSLAANNGLGLCNNAGFVMAALNWLLELEQTLPIEPRRPDGFKIATDKTQLNRIFVLFALALPAVVAAAGLFVRRQRLCNTRGAWR